MSTKEQYENAKYGISRIEDEIARYSALAPQHDGITRMPFDEVQKAKIGIKEVLEDLFYSSIIGYKHTVEEYEREQYLKTCKELSKHD